MPRAGGVPHDADKLFLVLPDVGAHLTDRRQYQLLNSGSFDIMDDDEIVAGMTSSKAINDKSDLNGKVTDKGDVRIWAG